MKKVLCVALVAAMGAAPSAHAEVRFSGFGQVVVGQMNHEGERFAQVAADDNNYDHDLNAERDSLVAVQMDADLGERVSATAQVLASGRKDFHPELAWAYVNAKLGKGFSAKVGRQRIPFYRYSDYLDVGQAYPWVRPPVAMYNQPWSNADMVNLSHNAYAGKWYSQAQAFVGRFDGEIYGHDSGVDAQLQKVRGASWEMEYDEWLSLRAAYVVGNVTVTGTSLDQATAALSAFGQGARAERLDYSADKGSFKSLGFKVNRADWLVIGEYAEFGVDDSVLDGADRRDWYATVGRRFGAVMPHVSYGRRDAHIATEALAGLPTTSPFYGPVYASLASQQLDESFRSVGVRWDVTAKVALKADWTRYRSDVPGTVDGDLVSAGVSFTF
ncbi:MAG TPA: hypothetical protein VIG68_02900 [Lysobacter sp.]